MQHADHGTREQREDLRLWGGRIELLDRFARVPGISTTVAALLLALVLAQVWFFHYSDVFALGDGDLVLML